MTHRIVITGIGWVTPLGHEVQPVWQKLLAGESGVGPTTHFDASNFPTRFSAQVKEYDYRAGLAFPEVHEGVGPNTAFALGAARQAWKSAKLDTFDSLNHERLGIYLGAGEGAIDFDHYAAANIESWDPQNKSVNTQQWAKLAMEYMTTVREIEQEANMPLSHLSMEFDALGPAYNCLTACAASTQAIGEATRLLEHGDADVMIAGGTHTMIHPLGVSGFSRLTALSTRNDAPQAASRPFDLTRDGFVMGEGAGMIILETLDHAKARGAPVLAQVVGYGSSADAYRITDIPPDGRGAVVAMRQALSDAGLQPSDVDYVSAHGTSTKENDSTETQAVKTVFRDHAKQLPVSSIKSMMGHLIAAAGAVELITCILAIRDQMLPPTINLTTPDPDCDLDYVANQTRSARIDVALSNSFGFGGQNDSLIIKRVG